jgi:hypothetical protein
MRKVLREITRLGLSSIEDNPDIGLKVRRLAAAGLLVGLRAMNAASEPSSVRLTLEEFVLSSPASPSDYGQRSYAPAESMSSPGSPSDDDQRSYAPAESMSPPFRLNALEVSVRARYDALLASNRELATRHQLLMKSVDELLKALDHIRPKMDPELAAHIDYDIYRVRRDLQ